MKNKKLAIKIFGLEKNPFNDELFSTLNKTFFDVFVFYTVKNVDTKNNTSWDIQPSYDYNYSYFGSKNFLAVLKNILKYRREYFIFTGYNSFSFIFGMVLCMLFKVKYMVFTDVPVIHKKNNLLKNLIRKFARWIAFQKSHGILTTGKPGRDALILLGCDECKIINFPYTPVVLRTPDHIPDRLRNIENLKGLPIIFFSGQLVYRKGIDILMQALSIIKNKGLKFYAIIEGDGPLKNVLPTIADQLDISDDIFFAGFNSPELHSYLLNKSDIVVSPSRWDPWGNIVPEAMSSEKVVIASSSVASALDRVNHGYNGLIFPTDNVVELSKHIESVISNELYAKELSAKAKISSLGWTSRLNAISLFTYLND